MYSDDNSQSRKNRKEYTMGNLIWPEGKKCAVMFTFDVDGDTTWENGNRGLPNGEKYIKSLSVGQYGPKRCVDRILDMLRTAVTITGDAVCTTIVAKQQVAFNENTFRADT